MASGTMLDLTGFSDPAIIGPRLVLESQGGRVDLNRADAFGS